MGIFKIAIPVEVLESELVYIIIGVMRHLKKNTCTVFSTVVSVLCWHSCVCLGLVNAVRTCVANKKAYYLF